MLIYSHIIGNDIGAGKLQVVVNAAGRTDKGVSAYGQVVSFYSWEELSLDDIMASINAVSPGNLRALHVQVVPRSFHATFKVISPHLSALALHV